MSFAEQLIKARKMARLSQLQLSQRCGVSQQAISKLESGKSSPSEYTMKQLAAALRIPLSQLLEEKKPAVPEDDGLKSMIISQVQTLSEPALVRLSDFLSGLEAGQEIAAQQCTDPGSAAGSDPSPLPPDPPGSSL